MVVDNILLYLELSEVSQEICGDFYGRLRLFGDHKEAHGDSFFSLRRLPSKIFSLGEQKCVLFVNFSGDLQGELPKKKGVPTSVAGVPLRVHTCRVGTFGLKKKFQNAAKIFLNHVCNYMRVLGFCST